MSPLPLFERLEIESQSHCNRSCWFCPRSFDRSGVYLDASAEAVHGRMPTPKILELLDQARAMGFRGQVAFYYYSEPLLDPRNLDLAREAARRGMRPLLTTNGDVLLGSPGLCEEIAAIYPTVVVGLYECETLEEAETQKRFWRDRLPVAELSFSVIGPSGREKNMAVPRALVPGDARMPLPDLVYPNAPCRRPLIRMLVRYDGEVANCCEDLEASFGLGNVFEKSLEEIWHSEHHRRIVEALAAGERRRYPLCRRCPQMPSGVRPDGQRLELARRQPQEGASKPQGSG